MVPRAAILWVQSHHEDTQGIRYGGCFHGDFLSDRTTRTQLGGGGRTTKKEGRNFRVRFSHLSTREKKLVSDVPGGR
jgi:hypothetical protein